MAERARRLLARNASKQTLVYRALIPIAALLLSWRRRQRHNRFVLGSYLLLTGSLRFAIEFVRVNERVLGALTVAHLASLAVAVAVWFVMSQRLPDIDPREVIQRNLGDARSAMADGRYTDPPERSAFHYYNAVLALPARTRWEMDEQDRARRLLAALRSAPRSWLARSGSPLGARLLSVLSRDALTEDDWDEIEAYIRSIRSPMIPSACR